MIKIGLDIFCRDDIRNALLGVAVASCKTANAAKYSDNELTAYVHGLLDGLQATAFSLGIHDLDIDALPVRHAPILGSGEALSGHR